MTEITGREIIEWGLPKGRWIGEMIQEANRMRELGYQDHSIIPQLFAMVPSVTLLHEESQPFKILLDAENALEQANRDAVEEHMRVLTRVPTVVAGAVMPDGCPSSTAPGTIPVGGVIAARNAIHPGMHSADICCSVACTEFPDLEDPKLLLDAVMATTHFGPGGRRDRLGIPSLGLQIRAHENAFLTDLERFVYSDFGSQGDGNHFAYVGRRASDGCIVLVTHHGSRGLGNALFKKGSNLAKRLTARLAPDVAPHNAWIPANTPEGDSYWDALQIVREWTRESHQFLHNIAGAKAGTRAGKFFWNEHNFVFRRDDGLFYHGKGATPSWDGFAADDSGLTLIPLNMAEPILVARHRDNPDSLGFAPHGAGRNMSRTQHLKTFGEFKLGRNEGGYLSAVSGGSPELESELRLLSDRGLDIRSFCGVPDLSELPSAYKNAASVRSQIEKYGLAEIVDTIEPYGSVMAGDWEKDAPWKAKRAEKRALKAAAEVTQ